MEQNGYSIAQYDMRFVKPLDEKLLHQVFKKHNKIITIEDGCVQGGFGSAILEFAADNNYKSNISRMGISDTFINHGTQDELYAYCYYDTAATIKAVHEVLEHSSVSQVG